MIQNILNMIEKIDKKVLRIIDIGVYCSFLVCVVGIIILMIQFNNYISKELYYIGIEIFKLGIISAVSFVVCGLGLSLIKEKMK